MRAHAAKQEISAVETTRGFTVNCEDGGYATLSRGDTWLHLDLASALRLPARLRHVPGQGSAQVFCDDVDALHEEFHTQEARIQNIAATHDHEIRDFNLHNLEGNLPVFGVRV